MAGVVALAPRTARAQGGAQELIDKAVTDYEALNVEQALRTFRQAISPSSPFEVSRAQRVIAYKYIGAALASQGMADSAIVYFKAALERDPFVDLDPAKFAPAEIEAMGRAKRQSFKAGIRVTNGGTQPLTQAVTLDPQQNALKVSLLTTHIGKMRAEFVNLENPAEKYPLTTGDIDGVSDLTWNGAIAPGRLIPEGSWQLMLSGNSSLTGNVDTTTFAFDVRWEYPPLEDTLPTLGSQYLLPERYASSSPWADLTKGVVVGAAAFGISTFLGNNITPGTNQGRGWLGPAMIGTSVSAGTMAFLLRRRDLSIPQNVAENNRRRAQREEFNRAVRSRNDDRLAQTKLLITPTAGVAR